MKLEKRVANLESELAGLKQHTQTESIPQMQ